MKAKGADSCLIEFFLMLWYVLVWIFKQIKALVIIIWKFATKTPERKKASLIVLASAVGLWIVINLINTAINALGFVSTPTVGMETLVEQALETEIYKMTLMESIMETEIAKMTEQAPKTNMPTVTLIPSPTFTLSPTITVAPVATIPNIEAAACVPKNTKREIGQVIQIVDGDTITVRMAEGDFQVRYIGIDTPEIGEPWGSGAATTNSNLVAWQWVTLVKDSSETDQYDRLLRYVFVADTFVNYELVKLGYAAATDYPPDSACANSFASEEGRARDSLLAIWSSSAVLPSANEQPVQQSDNVQIAYIFYDGIVSRVESDEYIEIINRGTTAVNMNGWRINAGNPGQDYTFSGIELQPGQACKVYTNEIHSDSCGGGSFFSGQAIWNNKGDCGYLYSANGEQVDEQCY